MIYRFLRALISFNCSNFKFLNNSHELRKHVGIFRYIHTHIKFKHNLIYNPTEIDREVRMQINQIDLYSQLF